MLNISPFSYGLIIRQGKNEFLFPRSQRRVFSSSSVYDAGSCFAPSILDIKPEDLRAKFSQGIQRLAAFSLGINYPNQASAPHLIIGGFKRLLALAASTDVEFEQAKTVSCDELAELIETNLSTGSNPTERSRANDEQTFQFCYWIALMNNNHIQQRSEVRSVTFSLSQNDEKTEGKKNSAKTFFF